MATRTAAAAAAATILSLAACGSAAPAHTAAAKPETCRQQYAAWRNNGPGKKLTAFTSALDSVHAQASAQDYLGLTASLEKAGKIAGEMEAAPPPKCADPAGYFGSLMVSVKAAGDNARSASGIGGILLAMGPLKAAKGTLNKLAAELERTVGK